MYIVGISTNISWFLNFSPSTFMVNK